VARNKRIEEESAKTISSFVNDSKPRAGALTKLVLSNDARVIL